MTLLGRIRRGRRAGGDLEVGAAVKPARRRRRILGGKRKSLLLLSFLAVFMLTPLAPAAAGPNDTVNDACKPADNPSPEEYGSGIDNMLMPPGYPSDKLKKTPPEQLSYYDRYGTSGQSWHAVDMGCSDAMAMVGNSIANVTFTLAKAIDRTTITVYQAASSESMLSWLKDKVDSTITEMGNTFGTRYWSWVVILGALWLAWWGLVRKRASRVAEGTIWMIFAMVGLIWLIGRPADFTTLGTTVSNSADKAFQAALPQSENDGVTCIPNDNPAHPQNTKKMDGSTRNANALWSTLVCKPWLMGEFGTHDPNSKIVKENADKLLWAQSIDLSEKNSGTKPDVNKKAETYKEVTKNVKENYPGSYSLYQGKSSNNRLAVAFGALFAALVAGLLILLISVLLIVMKIAFLLLLVAGPIFLGIGIHPGIGRVIATRWFELLLSTLLKQAALIGVLALLLWSYGLILSEGLPWGLQIMLLALVTFAAMIYRKPFQHLFQAVGYSGVGSRTKSDEHLQKSVTEVRKRSTQVATAGVGGLGGYRLARWTKRDSGEGTTGDTDGAGQDAPGKTRTVVAASDRTRADAPPLGTVARRRARGSGGGTTHPPDSRPPGSGQSGVTGGTPRLPVGGGHGGGGSSAPPDRGVSGGGVSRGPSWGDSVRRPPSGGTGGSSGNGGGTVPARGGDSPGPPRAGRSGGSGGGQGWFSNDGSGGNQPSGGQSGRSAPQRKPGSNSGAPPLWGDPRKRQEPGMPFWLKPVKRDDDAQ